MTQDMLRHTLAMVVYRGNKAVRNAPPGFSAFRAAPVAEARARSSRI